VGDVFPLAPAAVFVVAGSAAWGSHARHGAVVTATANHIERDDAFNGWGVCEASNADESVSYIQKLSIEWESVAEESDLLTDFLGTRFSFVTLDPWGASPFLFSPPLSPTFSIFSSSASCPRVS